MRLLRIAVALDAEVSPLGAKNLGELTAVSVAPAISKRRLSCGRQASARPADHHGKAALKPRVNRAELIVQLVQPALAKIEQDYRAGTHATLDDCFRR